VVVSGEEDCRCAINHELFQYEELTLHVALQSYVISTLRHVNYSIRFPDGTLNSPKDEEISLSLVQ